MYQLYVKKKSGNLENWDPDKIIQAIRKSALRVSTPLTEEEETETVALVENSIIRSSDNVIPVESLHLLVEKALREVRPDVAGSYMDYRNWVKRQAKLMDRVTKECNRIQFIGDKSNSNADSCMVSTKRVKKLDALETAQYEEYFLTSAEKEAAAIGYIYIHDKSARLDTMNCCLFNVGAVLTGGFEMGNIWYNEPKTLDVAFDVIGDITLMAASQQYGGFTIPEVDSLLERYAYYSYRKYVDEFMEIIQKNSLSSEEEEKAKVWAKAKVLKDLRQGFQGWEYKFNTVASSRGDYPFITATFGLNDSMWGREICKAILEVRRNGQGKEGHKKPVLFPKLVFLYDENLHGPGKKCEEVFEAGIQCSAKTMYPDWLSLTGEGYVAETYKKYGKAISPMGCRAFLSPYFKEGKLLEDGSRDHFYPAEDMNDEPIFKGRFNIGAVSLNLPMILAKSKRSGKDFYETLDYYLEMIRGIHLRTYEALGHMKASMNTLGFCEGGFYGGHLGLNDSIAPCLESATASFGITALNELQELYNGKSLVEDGAFALEVLKYINEKVEGYKKEDHRLYAIYGTPAESLCGRQVEQFRAEFGIITNVSDRPYVSNSFHCHVTEEISPIIKQNLEKRFWDFCNGGKIQYVRYPLGYNIESIRTLVRRAMKMGFYEGVNLSLAYCDDCGHEELEMDTCPCCGSRNLTKIDRMNGYLSYSRVHGDTRLNDAKMAEIAERKSM